MLIFKIHFISPSNILFNLERLNVVFSVLLLTYPIPVLKFPSVHRINFIRHKKEVVSSQNQFKPNFRNILGGHTFWRYWWSFITRIWYEKFNFQDSALSKISINVRIPPGRGKNGGFLWNVSCCFYSWSMGVLYIWIANLNSNGWGSNGLP